MTCLYLQIWTTNVIVFKISVKYAFTFYRSSLVVEFAELKYMDYLSRAMLFFLHIEFAL